MFFTGPISVWRPYRMGNRWHGPMNCASFMEKKISLTNATEMACCLKGNSSLYKVSSFFTTNRTNGLGAGGNLEWLLRQRRRYIEGSNVRPGLHYRRCVSVIYEHSTLNGAIFLSAMFWYWRGGPFPFWMLNDTILYQEVLIGWTLSHIIVSILERSALLKSSTESAWHILSTQAHNLVRNIIAIIMGLGQKRFAPSFRFLRHVSRNLIVDWSCFRCNIW